MHEGFYVNVWYGHSDPGAKKMSNVFELYF